MSKEEIYDFIGTLAIALYSKNIQISLSSLNSILKDKNSEYGSNRALASAISASYSRWKIKDPVIYNAIAHTYVNKDGELAWEK